MTCKNIQEEFTPFLNGELDSDKLKLFQTHLEECNRCRVEFQEINEIWTKLGILPEVLPSKNLRANFYKKLESYKNSIPTLGKPKLKTRFKHLVTSLLPVNPLPQLITVICLLIIGFGIGIFLIPINNTKSEMNALKTEIHNMQTLLAISLLKQKSSSDRIMGVNQTYGISKPDSNILNLLFETLNRDPSVNVRLATLDNIYNHRQSPEIQKNIYDSLFQQDSPLVQLNLIDLIAEIPTLKSVFCLENFLKNDNLHPDIKKRAKLVLEQIKDDLSNSSHTL